MFVCTEPSPLLHKHGREEGGEQGRGEAPQDNSPGSEASPRVQWMGWPAARAAFPPVSQVASSHPLS